MNAGKQASWIFLALIILACSGWYFASSNLTVKSDEAILNETPDIIIHQLTVKQYDNLGKLVNYLHTPEVNHIPHNDVHLLTAPHIVVKQENQSSWDIVSKTATAVHGGKKIIFSKDVHIEQKNTSLAASTLVTDELVYFPKRQYASTEAEVIYKQAGNEVRSKGMKAYLKEKRVKLLSQARGTYDPNQG